MNMKQDKMCQYQQSRSQVMEKETINAIKKMDKAGKKISFYSVMIETKRSKSYLYRNEKIRMLILSYRKPISGHDTTDTDKARVTLSNLECARLKRKVKALEAENSESWKRKYLAEHEKFLALRDEINELKQQLLCAYSPAGNRQVSLQ